VALAIYLWNVPYAISESVAILEDLQQKPLTDFADLRQPYLRPLFWLALWTIWHLAGSIPAALSAFKVAHIAVAAGLVFLFLGRLRPRNAVDASAAAMAVAVFAGSPAFRDNLENLPLNAMLIVMVLALAAWALLEREYRWWHDPALVGLTIAATGFKEQGLLLAVMVVGARLAGAPGVRNAAPLAVSVVTILYLAVRAAGSAAWPVFAQDVGIGWRALSTGEAIAEYGAFPYGIYAYNSLSTAANVLFSEPTSGVFHIARGLALGQVATWDINHVASSLALTAVIAWWGIRMLRGSGAPGTMPEARLFLIFLLMIAGSAAFGFNYTRDRFGGIAAVFYALAAYHAVRAAACVVVLKSRPLFTFAAAGLLMLAIAWQVRATGTVLYVRETAWLNQKEWLVDLADRREAFADRPVYLAMLEAMVEQGTDPSVTPAGPDPRWFATVFGDR